MTPHSPYEPGRAFALDADRTDPLSVFRERFLLPRSADGESLIYFCGNSLGLQPAGVRGEVLRVLDEWADHGVEAHFSGTQPWLEYSSAIVSPTADIVGALPGEIVVMNALTVNLHLMLASFYSPSPGRHRILTESRPFPSDRYALVSHAAFRGYGAADTLVELSPRPGEWTLRTEDIEGFLEREGKTVATLLFSGVHYYTGQAFDIERITRAAHSQGCLVGFDLAHAAGNVPLRLHDWDVDFAVWCSYKYLNAGPGSPGGVFVHERHHGGNAPPRLAGWWGEEPQKRFSMTQNFLPASGAAGWEISNPPVPMLAAYRAAVSLFAEAGMGPLRSRSERLTGYLAFLLNGVESGSFSVITPDNPRDRGAQISLLMRGNGRKTFETLLARGVICDWRDPDVIRIAPVPLYNTFTEVYDCVQHFGAALRAAG